MTYPSFASGDVLNASDMNAVGLWLVKTQTVGSAVSSVTVTSAFSSTYDNYLITLTGGSFSTTAVWGQFQFSSAHTTGYYGSSSFVDTAGAVTNQGTSNLGRFLVTRSSNTVSGGASWLMHVSNPATAVRKNVWGISSGGYLVTHGGVYDGTSTFTDFVLSPTAGTITGGTIRVYGYRN